MTHKEDLAKRLHIVLQTKSFAFDLETAGKIETTETVNITVNSKLTELT